MLYQLDAVLNLEANHLVADPMHSGNHYILLASSVKPQSPNSASNAAKNVSGLVLASNLVKLDNWGVGTGFFSSSKLLRTSYSANLSTASVDSLTPVEAISALI